jgi:hypothetical protein
MRLLKSADVIIIISPKSRDLPLLSRIIAIRKLCQLGHLQCVCLCHPEFCIRWDEAQSSCHILPALAKCMETRIFPTTKSYCTRTMNKRNNDKIKMKLPVVQQPTWWLVPVFTNFRAGATSVGSPHTQSSCR